MGISDRTTRKTLPGKQESKHEDMKIARNAIIISGKVNSTENERNFTISIYPKLRAKYVF
jgi:hypothetical protein